MARQRYVDAFQREGPFESVGLLIDRVLWPQRILAHKIADIVRVPRAIDSARFAKGRVTMLEYVLEEGDPYMFTPLASLQLPEGVLAVGAIRNDTFTIPVGTTQFEPGDRVAIMSRTRLEWTLADFALWMVGAVPVPIYETSSVEQVRGILQDSGAVAILVEDSAMTAGVARVREELPALRDVWQIEAGALDELVAAGADVTDEALQERRAGFCIY